MKKRALILFIVVALISGALIYWNQNPRGLDSLAAVYPWSYAITAEVGEHNAKVNIVFSLFDTRKNSKRTDPGLYSAGIISKADLKTDIMENQFEAEITAINEGQRLYHNGEPFYTYDCTLSVPLTVFFDFEDAHLVFTYNNDGSYESFYFGDISFIPIPEAATDKHMLKRRALPVLDLSTFEMTAFVIELNVAEELQLESFDFGLPKYGIDRDRVVCLQKSMNRIETLYSENALDTEYEGIYSLQKVEYTDTSLEGITLKPGINTLIIPFTIVKGAALSPIAVFGGLINYSVDGVSYSYPVESLPYVMGLPPQTVEAVLNDAWR